MPVMSNDQIAHALEKIRSGELEADGDSDVENYLLSVLHSDGQDAVGALLLNLEGMEFTLVNALEASPLSIFRSGHEDNPLTVELFATNDAAVLGGLNEYVGYSIPLQGRGLGGVFQELWRRWAAVEGHHV